MVSPIGSLNRHCHLLCGQAPTSATYHQREDFCALDLKGQLLRDESSYRHQVLMGAIHQDQWLSSRDSNFDWAPAWGRVHRNERAFSLVTIP